MPHLTVGGGPFIAAASNFIAAGLVDEHDDRRHPEELQTIAEIVVRLLISFMLAPAAAVDLGDRRAAERFARRYLGPLLTGT